MCSLGMDELQSSCKRFQKERFYDSTLSPSYANGTGAQRNGWRINCAWVAQVPSKRWVESGVAENSGIGGNRAYYVSKKKREEENSILTVNPPQASKFSSKTEVDKATKVLFFHSVAELEISSEQNSGWDPIRTTSISYSVGNVHCIDKQEGLLNLYLIIANCSRSRIVGQ